MDQIEISDVPVWLLSGKPVVRFKGRDFEQSVADYDTWLHALGEATGLHVLTKTLADPPGVVVVACAPGDTAADLKDPMLRVGKTTCPWLFCVASSCRERVPVPGMPCEKHR